MRTKRHRPKEATNEDREPGPKRVAISRHRKIITSSSEEDADNRDDLPTSVDAQSDDDGAAPSPPAGTFGSDDPEFGGLDEPSSSPRQPTPIFGDPSSDPDLSPGPIVAGPQLSWGVELECVFIFHMNFRFRLFPPTFAQANGNGQSMVARLLGGHNIAIRMHDHITGPAPYSQWKLTDDLSIREYGDKELQQIVKEKDANLPSGPPLGLPNANDTIQYDHEDEICWDDQEMEFCSPKYTGTDMDRCCQDLNIITTVPNTPESWLHLNRSCGIHVHIGRNDNRNHSLRALKALSFATIVFEEEIDKLHAPERARNVYCASNRIDFRVRPGEIETKPTTTTVRLNRNNARNEHWEALKVHRIETIREMIWSKTSYHDLCLLIGDDQHSRYNFGRIDPIVRPSFYTVEFRQHAGSLDADEIKHWIMFCKAMVEWAYKNADLGRDRCLEKIKTWSSRRINIVALLEELNLPTDTYSHLRARVQRTRSNGAIRRTRHDTKKWQRGRLQRLA